MVDTILNELAIAPKSAVIQAARQFAETLSNSVQFRKFEKSYFDFREDAGAQSAIQEFQKKQASLKALLMLNAVSQEDRQELQRLQDRFLHQPSVQKYAEAQEELMVVCQGIGDQLSEAIGLDYGSSCRTGGCCG